MKIIINSSFLNFFKKFLKIAGAVCLLLAFLMTAPVNAQVDEEVPDSKGNDFWLTFLPNYHNNRYRNDPRLSFGDSLYIFVAASEPTTGSISYRDRNNKPFTHKFSIPNPQNIHTFKVSYFDFELLGFNDSRPQEISPDAENGRVLKHSFHVETDKDVTVYALNQAVTTSDAFLVLPTDAVDTTYMVMSYHSDKDTPSQFAVVATEDGTKITINPTADIFLESAPIIKMLNKGEVYLIQANVDADPNADLTGTEITSSKPVAVFSGHQRAALPYNFDFGGNRSRDHLVEQLPPKGTWGRNAFLVPYPTPRDFENGENNAPDMFRILAGYDTTRIKINGTLVQTLQKGQIYEAVLSDAASIVTSRPALVAQFKKTSQVPGAPQASKLSDPFMMMIPPSEQFLKSYRFMNAQAYEYELDDFNEIPKNPTLTKTYQEQYLSVVAPTSFLATVRLDGNIVPAGNFKAIPQSEYSYATLRVGDGVHAIEADTNIGIYVFGYGFANSYGYIGGMAFRPIDFEPPRIKTVADCYDIRGSVYDSSEIDSRIKFVRFPDEFKKNITVSIQQETPDSLHFLARLTDIFNDGKFVILSEDVSGLESDDTVTVPGFTVGTKFLKNGDIETIESDVPFDRERCFTVKVYNYGAFPQDISKIRLANNSPEYTLTAESPLRLEPGDTTLVRICFKGPEGEFSDTLIIGEPCIERKVAVLNIRSMQDKKAPEVLKDFSECRDLHIVSITDSLQSDAGIAAVDVVNSQNITFATDIKLPLFAVFTAQLTDPYLDGFYTLRTTDSVGNTVEFRDTIQGYTLAFPGITGSGPAVTYSNHAIGFLNCDSINVVNYGMLPFVIENVMMENVYFSLPPAQFPVILQPGENRWMKICYRPLEALQEMYRDTLVFSHQCIEKKIPVQGESISLISEATAQCEIRLRLTTQKVPQEFFLEQNFPNPVNEEARIIFGVAEAAPVTITLYDARGVAVATILDEKREAGLYELDFVPKNIAGGLYLYELRSGATRITRTMFIAK